MTIEAQVYAKEQQIKLIDNILCSLCSVELTSEGRKYLKKMKQRLSTEIIQLRYKDSKQLGVSSIPTNGKKSIFEKALGASW